MSFSQMMKNSIFEFAKDVRGIYFKATIPAHSKKIRERIKANYEKTNTITVVFIAQFPEMWNSERTLVKRLENSENVKTYILCIPKCKKNRKNAYDQAVFYNDNEAYQYLREIHHNVIDSRKNVNIGFDSKRELKEEEIVWYELGSLKPDYIFVQRPYEMERPKCYSDSKITKYGRLCYIPYGYCLTKGTHVKIELRDRFMARCNLFFAECDYKEQYFKDHCRINTNKVICKGYPRFEHLLNRMNVVAINDSKTVLWTPRWSVSDKNDKSHFIEYVDVLLKYFNEHKQYSLIIRPHPLMFSNFIKNNIITEEEVERFYKTVNKSDNIYLDSETDYSYSFCKSSILLSDYTSLLIEYFITEKPVVYCGKTDHFTNEMLTVSKTFYLVNNQNEMLNSLDSLLKGYDKNAILRKDIIPQIVNNHISASENIYHALLEDASGK